MKSINEKGITLIALVVTIIILLILAGVTISQLSGDNGLFSKVRESVEKYKKAQDDEEIAIGQLEAYLINSGEEDQDYEYEVAEQNDVIQGKVYYDK